jgi:hypothetical protein
MENLDKLASLDHPPSITNRKLFSSLKTQRDGEIEYQWEIKIENIGKESEDKTQNMKLINCSCKIYYSTIQSFLYF